MPADAEFQLWGEGGNDELLDAAGAEDHRCEVLCVPLVVATDGLPALALAVDPPEPDLMRRKPRDPSVGIFTRPVVAMLLSAGLWSALVNISLFTWLLQTGRPLAEVMAMTFVCLVLIQFFNAYNCRSDRQSDFRRPFRNRS